MLRKWEGYEKGVNLGGWLSQCDYNNDHMENFITEADIKTIKAWGMDHIRLPFDFNIIQDQEGKFKDEGFALIDRAVKWAEQYNLNIILDLHKAAGFSFDKDENEVGLFGNPLYEKRFIDLWIIMAARYGKIGPNVSFELLNEVTSPSFNADWMSLAARTIQEIRRIAPDVQILIGGYWNNSPDAVKDLILPPDDKVYYNFHCYTPMCFTHQGAGWVDGMFEDFRLRYPFSYDNGEADGAREAYEKMCMPWPAGMSDLQKLEDNFSSAVKTAAERNVILYCGEYGVIDLADAESTLNWYKDICVLFKKYNIGHAAWNYKEKNFGLCGKHYSSIIDDIVKLM